MELQKKYFNDRLNDANDILHDLMKNVEGPQRQKLREGTEFNVPNSNQFMKCIFFLNFKFLIF